MTGSTIVVAPREITDLAFRACRVGGCDPSVADRIALDVTHCEVHRGCGLDRLAALLSDEALADTFRSTQRARLDDGRSGCCIECPCVDAPPEDDSGVGRAALANGVSVDVGSWTQIERVAVGFVLSEAIIDAADTPTV